MFEINLGSLERFKEKILGLAPLLRRRYLRKALRAGAVPVQRVASTPGIVPVLAKPVFRNGRMIRKPGTLQRRIIIRRSKDTDATGDVGVIVNVLPAKGAQRGAYSPDDPFYWRFVHFGTKYMRARPFLTIGARELPGASLREIERVLGSDMKQLNLPGFER